jgi:hypothetical protein
MKQSNQELVSVTQMKVEKQKEVVEREVIIFFGSVIVKNG